MKIKSVSIHIETEDGKYIHVMPRAALPQEVEFTCNVQYHGGLPSKDATYRDGQFKLILTVIGGLKEDF